MGITIHYHGRAVDPTRIDAIIATAVAAAQQQGWNARPFSTDSTTLPRSSAGREWEYTGPTQGVVITPHEQCEPLCLEFDRDGVVQDFVKTQFAGATTHAHVVDLLRALSPAVEWVEVLDEGEYWETGNRERLHQQIDSCNAQLAEILRHNSRARGPLRLENGRLVDVIEIDDQESSRTPWWKFW